MLCHLSTILLGCNGWSDDGTSCTKPCASQSTTPYSCSHLQCATSAGDCVISALSMAFSIIDMLSSICPASKIASVGKKFVQAASTAARKAILKEFARGIAKSIYKKAKKKAQKFMKTEGRALKESAVDAILNEAAESIAIERAKKSKEFQHPDLEDVARGLDFIGVSGVVDAFSLNSCNAAELDTFPGCHEGWAYSDTYWSIYGWTEEVSLYPCSALLYSHLLCTILPHIFWFHFKHCCGQVDDGGWHKEWKVHFLYCHLPIVSNEASGSELVANESGNTTSGDALDPWADDDGYYSDPNTDFVDFIPEVNNITKEELFLCNECLLHAACQDNETVTTDLIFFNSCMDAGCCDYGPPSNRTEVPDINILIENVLPIIRSRRNQTEEPDMCDQCDMFCDDAINQEQHPMFYNHCNDKGCCGETN